MRLALVTALACALVLAIVGPADAHSRRYAHRQQKHVVHRAKDRLGANYCWGGSGGCYDCSGLTMSVFDGTASLPHSAADQWRKHKRKGWRAVWRKSKLHKGDLVFFKDTYTRGISHVGVYIGHHRFIHASDGGVRKSSLHNPYYRHHYKAAARPGALRWSP
jgi:cell wall-associated NlpC family hydrolase